MATTDEAGQHAFLMHGQATPLCSPTATADAAGGSSGSTVLAASEELAPTVDVAALDDAAESLEDTATAPQQTTTITTTAARAAAVAEQLGGLVEDLPEQQQQQQQRQQQQRQQMLQAAAMDLAMQQLRQLLQHGAALNKPLPNRSHPLQHQQQQQQQRQRTNSVSMDLEQLHQLLLASWLNTNGAAAASVMTPFRLWAAAVNSSDAATLLRQPAALLHLLGDQGFTDTTAAGYLASVERVLTLPAVAALLNAAELASLLQLLWAAKDAYRAGAAETSATVAAAATNSNHAANGKQQQQQQQRLMMEMQTSVTAVTPPPPQQQQQVEGASTLDLQQLQEVLEAHNRNTRVIRNAFRVWSRACCSANVTTMLQQPDSLLQALQQLYAPSTAISYLEHVLVALQLPAVAALLPAAELLSVLQQLLEATQHMQQQHQQVNGASAMNLQQLQRVLSAYYRGKAARATNAMLPFKVWSNACGSTDVKTMLQQPAVLLQALQGKYKAITAVGYLNIVLAVLKVPAVAALLPPLERACLLQQLKEAVQEYNGLRRLSTTRRSFTAATPAAAPCCTSAPHPHNPYQHQQQQQHTRQQVAFATRTAQPPATAACCPVRDHAAVLAASLADLQQQQLASVDDSSSNSKEQQVLLWW
jgi:hypothetical protein